jgi:hypothetical protein
MARRDDELLPVRGAVRGLTSGWFEPGWVHPNPRNHHKTAWLRGTDVTQPSGMLAR